LQGNPLILKPLTSNNRTYESWFNGFVPTEDGGLVSVGYSIDSTMKTFIVKYGINGDTIFTKDFLSPYYPSQIFISPWGGLAKMPSNELIIGCVVEKNVGDSDIYLIKTDSVGNLIWNKNYGSSKREISRSIYTDANGNIFLGGIIDNLNTNTQNFTYQCDIRQLDSEGNLVWNYLSPNNIGLRDAANDMLLLDDGSIVVASGVGHEEIHPPWNEVLFDRHVFKLNPEHQLAWELTFPDPFLIFYAKTTKLVGLSDGSGYVMAGMGPIFADDPDDPGSIGGFFTKISTDGDSIWTRKYLYPSEHVSVHEPFDMKETPDGGLIICGKSEDYDDNATFPQQGWLLKLDKHGCLVPGCHLSDTAEETNPPAASISIYPNPTSNYLNFYVQAPINVNDANIRIVDSNGRRVKEFKANDLSSTFIIPVWDWADGAYWVQLTVDGKLVSTKKFLKIGK
jgi:hypothetical protein